ncbi:Bax inhibitor-1/YccA family protein [Wolbachia endosymbiont of Pentidionis agamae]|uniref:Bax inhibitor-1/YccA family protein n=1 Tax=Wolbachia endosymbiont of Pentidionis agamae TaxID=3110435 RepID=UPI002FD25C53
MSSIKDKQNIRSDGVYYSAGLRDYLTKVYNYMALALGVTGLVAFLVASSGLFLVIHYNPFISLLVIFSPIALVLFMRFRFSTLSTQSVIAMFFTFSALMGLSLSYIFLLYTKASIARAFFITSIMFGSMALYGNNTKKDLTSFGSFLIMGSWGLFVALLVNLFLDSRALHFAISFISVIVFTLMTAYDAQRIKDIYYQLNDGSDTTISKVAIIGATDLYFNFINIFLSLLRLIGLASNRD